MCNASVLSFDKNYADLMLDLLYLIADVCSLLWILMTFCMFQENIKPDGLEEKRRDVLFRKFIKKWNGNRLPKVSLFTIGF